MIVRKRPIPIKDIGLIHASALTSETVMSNNTSSTSDGIYNICQKYPVILQVVHLRLPSVRGMVHEKWFSSSASIGLALLISRPNNATNWMPILSY